MKRICIFFFLFSGILVPSSMQAQRFLDESPTPKDTIPIHEVPDSLNMESFLKFTEYYWNKNDDTTGGKPAFTLTAKIEYYGAYFAGKQGGYLTKKRALNAKGLYIKHGNSESRAIKGFDATFSSPTESDSSITTTMHSKNDMLTDDMLNYLKRYKIINVIFCNIRCRASDGSTITLPNISFTVYKKEKLIHK